MVLRGSKIVPGSIYGNSEKIQQNCEDICRINSQINLSKEEKERCRLHTERKKILLKQKKNEAEYKKSWFQLFSGAISGAIARTTVAPIDRIKILMQTNFVQENSKHYNSFTSSFSSILKNNGVSGLWKGNGVNCIRVMPHTGIQFASYEIYKKYLVNNSDKKLNIKDRLLSGTCAGITAGTFTHPIDLVRVRLQTQPNINTIKHAIKNVYSEKGLISFYKGYVPAMCSLGPFIAINFATYDTLKTYISINYPEKINLTSNILFMGGVAGLTAQTACYPLDTIRRRSETYGRHYSSMYDAFTKIARNEGVRGFYRGMLANSMKVVPNNFIRFFIFEILNKNNKYFIKE